MTKRYRLADYRREATKPPFVLEIDEERSLEIQAPDTNTILDVQATADVRQQVKLLTGDKYAELMEVIGSEQGGVLKVLMRDLSEHFNLGE
jgi:hypothetical protein